jgi:hypothetical protein
MDDQDIEAKFLKQVDTVLPKEQTRNLLKHDQGRHELSGP